MAARRARAALARWVDDGSPAEHAHASTSLAVLAWVVALVSTMVWDSRGLPCRWAPAAMGSAVALAALAEVGVAVVADRRERARRRERQAREELAHARIRAATGWTRLRLRERENWNG